MISLFYSLVGMSAYAAVVVAVIMLYFKKKSKKTPTLKKILLACIAIFIFSFVIVSVFDKDNDRNEESEAGSDTNADFESEYVGEDLVESDLHASSPITLIAGEAGDYGKTITYNAGTEFEESLCAYYVPVGTYAVTNKGTHATQISIYSDETKVSADGWEEPSNTAYVSLIDVDETVTIEIKNGYHIEITEPAHIELVAK